MVSSGKRVESLVKKFVSREVIGSYLEALPEVQYTPKKRSMLENVKSLFCTDNIYAKTAILGGILGFTFVMGGKLAKRN